MAASKRLTLPVKEGPRLMGSWRQGSAVRQFSPKVRHELEREVADPELLGGGLGMRLPEERPARSLSERLMRAGKIGHGPEANFVEDEFSF